MSPASAADLIDAVRQHGLLEPAQLDEAAAVASRFTDAGPLADELVRRGWLTAYQAGRLAAGVGAELALGAYVVLERLGAGGMGEVFAARHRLMNRRVALKVIRPELLESPQVVRRFRREIETAARLSHPHIIVAHDAEQAGDRFFLVMEHGDGPTLGDLVRRRGPLPAGLACEYVRQAALGLQHALERGVLHRDIKPDNLLVTSAGVKILDLGLARLLGPGPAGGSLTGDAIVGTPDYMAPEQADNVAAADTRADLYSLGCTLYFALAGQVPFPGGTLMEKLLRHRLEQPRPMAALNEAVPSEVQDIVGRLMAKQPADRFQTPAELAAALAPHATAAPLPPPPDPGGFTGEWPAASAGAATASAPPLPPAVATAPPAPAKPPAPRRRRVPVAGWLAAAGLAAALVAAVVFFRRLPVAPPPPGSEVPRLELTGVAPPPFADEVNVVAFAPRADLLAVGCGSLYEPKRPGAVHLLDPATARLLGTLPGHAAGVMTLAFSPDGRVLAAGTCSADAPVTGEVRLWEVATRRLLATLAANRGGVNALAFHPSGGLLATAGRDWKIHLWDLRKIPAPVDPGAAPQTWDHASAAHVGTLGGHEHDVLTLAFTPDGALLASGGTDHTVRLWDVTGRTPTAVYRSRRGGPVFRLDISPDGRYLAAGTGTYQTPGSAAEIMLVHLADRRLDERVVEPGRDVDGVCFTPDSRFLLTGDQDGALHVWDVPGLTRRDSTTGHAKWLWSIAFTSDGRRVATGSWDRTVRLWRWGTAGP